MNAMNVSPIKPPISSESHANSPPTVPSKIPLPSNPLVSQTNHNSFPNVPVTAVTHEIPFPPNTDKPLNLYITSAQKHTSNGLSAPSSSNLETLKPIPLPNSLPPPAIATNLVTKENAAPKVETTTKQNESSASDLLVKQDSTDQNVSVSVVTNQKALEPAVTDVTVKSTIPVEKENVQEKVQVAVPDNKNTDKVKEKEIKIIKDTTINSSVVKKEVSFNLKPKFSPVELATESYPAKKRKREQPDTVVTTQEEKPVENEDRKPKRIRLPTQIYQSPLPELQLIAKLNTPPKPQKSTDEKLTTFYKNEFLAVRNPEGSFYICQSFQNIHRKSTKIKIRWFTHLPNDVFTPDFCDTTEFDCILTNVQLVRLEKDKWKLPENERVRVDNILKRALDVEKGVTEKPSVTEEHPDGLDLSLYKDEAQLNKRKRKTSLKKKVGAPKKKQQLSATQSATSSSVSTSKKTPQTSYLNQSLKSATSESKSRNTATVSNNNRKAQIMEKRSGSKNSRRKSGSDKQSNASTSEAKGGNSSAPKLVYAVKKKAKVSNQKKASKSAIKTQKSSANVNTTANLSTNKNTGNKRSKKEHKVSASSSSTDSEKPVKIRNAGSAVTAKINSAAMRMGKITREQRGANQKKK